MTERIRGMDELNRNLKRLGEKFSGKLEAAVEAGVLIVQNATKIKSPWLSGNLSRSYHMETTEKTSERVVMAEGTDVIYAAPQEFGTSTIPAHSHLRPALDENSDKVKQEIREALADLLKGTI